MVKLTPDLIQQSMQYINPVRDRELDLRGNIGVDSNLYNSILNWRISASRVGEDLVKNNSIQLCRSFFFILS
jgi:hypothetical protein